MYTYELFEIENGYGFNILCDGSIIIKQEYMPDVDGYIIMTFDEAKEFANILLARIKGE